MRDVKIKPKMTHEEAKALWNNLTPSQKIQFSEMLIKMEDKELHIAEVTVDDNEHIRTVTLEPVDKTPKPIKPFAKYFDQK